MNTTGETLDEGFSGGCFCGAVTYTVSGPPKFAYYCHCSDCRRINGTAYHTGIALDREHFCITAGNPVPFATKADSGHTITRWSCPVCASQLWSVTTADNRMVSVKAGTVTSHSHGAIRPSLQIFHDSRVDWADAPDTLTTYAKGMRGQEPLPRASRAQSAAHGGL